MRSGKNSGLWWYFVSMVFIIILSFVLIMSVLAILYFQIGDNTWEHGNPLPPILTMMLFSLVIGTTISIMVGRKILAPITDFSKAAKEIAGGNFNIYLNESHRVNEISEVAHHFNLMVQELRSIETLRNDFVVNVSHEFKTPIAAIEGYAMLLQEENLSKEEHDEYTGMIIESSRQLSNLSGNILKISKLENQEMLTEQTEYSLDEQLRQALLLLDSSSRLPPTFGGFRGTNAPLSLLPSTFGGFRGTNVPLSLLPPTFGGFRGTFAPLFRLLHTFGGFRGTNAPLSRLPPTFGGF
jgi:signal transduction histidine kinase